MSNLTKVSFSDMEMKQRSVEKTKKIINNNKLWTRQFTTAIQNAGDIDKIMKHEYSQEDLRKICYSGVKLIESFEQIRDENRRLGTDFNETLQAVEEEFTFIELVVDLMGCMTLPTFMTTFPITKEFDGEKWGVKDYFFTMDAIKDLDKDEPLGHKKAVELLCDYENDLLFGVYAELMHVMDGIRRFQGQKTLREEFMEDMGIGMVTVNQEAGYMKDNTTGEVVGIKKASHLHLVK